MINSEPRKCGLPRGSHNFGSKSGGKMTEAGILPAWIAKLCSHMVLFALLYRVHRRSRRKGFARAMNLQRERPLAAQRRIARAVAPVRDMAGEAPQEL